MLVDLWQERNLHVSEVEGQIEYGRRAVRSCTLWICRFRLLTNCRLANGKWAQGPALLYRKLTLGV